MLKKMKTTNKLIMFTALLAVMLMAMSGITSAVMTCAVTDTYTNTNNCIKGTTQSITVAVSGVAGYGNATKLDFFYGIAGGTYTLLGSNATVNLTTYTMAFDTTGVSDSASGRINVTMELLNISASDNRHNVSCTLFSIEVDNTAPSISLFELTPDVVREKKELRATCTATDGIDSSLTYLQNLSKPNGVFETQSSAFYRWMGISLDLPMSGYNLSCRVTDNCGTTYEASEQFNVYSEKASEAEIVATEQKMQPKDNNLLIAGSIAVLFIIIVLTGVGYVSKKGRKRRHR